MVDPYEEYYKSNLSQIKEVGWHNEEKAKERYEKACQLIYDCNGGSILDVGCGTGNLVEYLHPSCNCYDYTGIDISKHYVDKAKLRYTNEKFIHGGIHDINAHYDTIVSIGVFSLGYCETSKVIKDIKHLLKHTDCLIINGFHKSVTVFDEKYLFDIHDLIELSQEMDVSLEIDIFKKYEFFATFKK